jgi:hypothetical protein
VSLFVGALLASVLSATHAHAYRPFDGTDAAVAPRGEFELELGPVGYLRDKNARYFSAPAAILNFGLVDRMELVLEGRELIALTTPTEGPRGQFTDTAASLKFVLRRGTLQGASGPSVATEIGALLPTINGEDGLGFTAALIGSQQWELTTLHLNLAARLTREGEPELFGGVIWEGPDKWRARPVLELFYEHEFGGGGDTVWSALDGVIIPLHEDFTLDAGLRLARVETTNVFELRAGFTWGLRLWGGS